MTTIDGWRTCPRCASALAREGRSVTCGSCGLAVYAQPAPAVCGIVVDERGRALLGRRRDPPREGTWDVLGGFLEEYEDPLDGLRRELREETSLEIEPTEFLCALADTYGEGGPPTLNLFWAVRATAGVPKAADDVAELGWFAAEDLPPAEELAFANTAAGLAEWQRRQKAASADVVGVFEVQLVVSDLDAMTTFYRERIGLEISLHDPERGRTHFRTRTGQLILALAESEPDSSPDWPGLPPPLLTGADRRGPTPAHHGAIHFALEVEAGDLVGRGERLRAFGLDVRGPFRWPGGQRSVYLRDPEANVLELIANPA